MCDDNPCYMILLIKVKRKTNILMKGCEEIVLELRSPLFRSVSSECRMLSKSLLIYPVNETGKYFINFTDISY